MKNSIDFEKEMTLEVLEERLEMAANYACCEEGGADPWNLSGKTATPTVVKNTVTRAY